MVKVLWYLDLGRMRQQFVPLAGVLAADAARILNFVSHDKLVVYDDVEPRQETVDPLRQLNGVKAGDHVNAGHDEYPHDAAKRSSE